MLFSQLQRTISELMDQADSSVADYLSLSKELASQAEEVPNYFRKIKVAFLSNFTIQGLPEVFRIRALAHNIWAETYLAPYNQYAQEILSSGSGFNKFNPKLVFLIFDPVTEQLNQLYELALLILDNHAGAKVVFLSTKISSHGNNDSIHFINLVEFLKKYDLSNYWGTKYKDLGDLRLALDTFPKLADFLMAEAVVQSGATKKCLVLDLDNTVWSGIVGEDEFDSIIPDREFQERVIEFYRQGAIVAVNSKNNLEDALKVLEKHPDMLLRKEHLAAWRINWQSKSQNMAELASELNLGLDSFVFVDDDPFQLAEIRTAFPEVTTLLPRQLKDYPGFTSAYFTEEDRRRGQMYAEERNRRELKSSLKSFDDFFKELRLEVTIREVKMDSDSIPRIAQMTQKTNQFNMTTSRWDEGEIKYRLKHKNNKMWTIEAIDRFGDYGIVGFLSISLRSNSYWEIDNFLMSCRILGRGIEKAFLANLIEDARGSGIRKIVGLFKPTQKNKTLCERFYLENSFITQATITLASGETEIIDEVRHYYDVGNLYPYPKSIKVNCV